MNTNTGPVTLVSVYAPTFTSESEAKEQFYSQLEELIASIPETEDLLLLGDLNARVGMDIGSWRA